MSLSWNARACGSVARASVFFGIRVLCFRVFVEFGAVEANDSVASHFLGDVQRLVSRLEHFLPPSYARVRPRSYSEAHSALEGTAFERKCIIRHPLPHPFCERDSRIQHCPRQKEQKFLAAVAP